MVQSSALLPFYGYSKNGFAELRQTARQDPTDPDTLRRVGTQFESFLIQTMLKSMREAGQGGGVLDNKQVDFYQGLFDQQIAFEIARHGRLGLADRIAAQLGNGTATEKLPVTTQNFAPPRRQMEQPSSIDPNALPAFSRFEKIEKPSAVEAEALPTLPHFETAEDFVRILWPHAQRAAQSLGLDPRLLLAQAALETGWGKQIIRTEAQGSSHNLFNIKADSRWQGPATQISTLEYRQGVAVREQAPFRAYESFDQSFNDYVAFLRQQPRYHHALTQTHSAIDFMHSLAEAGYATDPAYADKVLRVFKGGTLSQALEKSRIAVEDR
ncbi:Mannosyl-glycoprotein endo-beta-N-acetylglucosamidase [Nitrosococcus oceani ATCC 19707]|uniref:Peptidoglycan hydrolase FlgJ n=2 Tax=Nitrosococcus oceani TaxID=1229 RepID=Q3J8L8_NITOC|nr:flagellar assembly peptidoglycan hydrolase FlgJ [Nitrosococcus oceani]ABA58828.1 Mannosyl-glycoprotein endo-beta-N-acetylglucosamidase [Nitrosococcus oceani ATCC 19707]EDZ68068.1 flagellar rod assembly protein/muramidase FlgJ [Nitrosococcus oceani AFC27]KFI18629.1 glucosaminidase [Nitrosococcus oceani C-27]GEM19081.1 flagellar assembly peptidoglycan hydrolase FlgJ [Nitrosococcus oceani]